jgi:phasin family protein
MYPYYDQLVTVQRQSLEAAQAIAMASFEGVEKLTQLNVQAARASVEETIQRSMSLLGTQDPKLMADAIIEAVKPSGEKFTAYAKHVYDIASETRAEISNVVEKQFSDANRQVVTSLESLAVNSPVGSEGVVTMVKSAISAAGATWNQVSRAGHQVAEATDVSVANATNEVLAAGPSAEAARS